MDPSSRDPPVIDPAPAPRTEEHPGERVLESDLSGLDQKRVEMSKILDQIHEKLNKRSIEIEIKEKSIIERLKVVEDKEREMESRLSAEISLTRLAVEKEKEEAMKAIEDKEKEVELLAKLNHEKSYQLVRDMEQFDVKQKVAAERKRLDTEQLETREKELNEKDDILKVKAREIEAKEKEFEEKVKEQKQRDLGEGSVQTEIVAVERRKIEAEVLIKKLEAKEKELDEKEEILKAKAEEIETKSKLVEQKMKELELKQKQRDLGEGSVQGVTAKRSRAENSVIRCSKRHKHGDEDKETKSSSEEPNGGDIEEEQEDVSTELVPITCVEAEFNDFKKTINSFEFGQLWALYDRKDAMPRLYGRISRVIKSRSCIQVKVVKPRDEQVTVSLACGKFQNGILETKDHSMFSHQLSRTKRGNNFIGVYPKKGETWAMFKDWSKNWNFDHELHKQPYKYDFVEILVDFDENLGVAGVYLEKVDGFVSVFKHARQRESKWVFNSFFLYRLIMSLLIIKMGLQKMFPL